MFHNSRKGKKSESAGVQTDSADVAAGDLIASEDDRTRMLQIIMAVAEAVIASSSRRVVASASLSDVADFATEDRISVGATAAKPDNIGDVPPNPTLSSRTKLSLRSVLSSSNRKSNKRKPSPAEERHERRIRKVLSDDLFHLVASSLLIRESDHKFAQNPKVKPLDQLSDAFGCVVLLLSNVILLTSNHSYYDARVRHVLKTACVYVLYMSMKPDAMSDFDVNKLNETVGAGLRKGFDAANSKFYEYEIDADEAVCRHQSSANGKDKQLKADGSLSEMKDITAKQDTDKVKDTNRLAQLQSNTRFVCTRKFEAIEKKIAMKLLKSLLTDSNKKKGNEGNPAKADANGETSKSFANRKNLIRGLKIGTAGVVAGSLLAVTGGLAAPGIAAGIASLGIVSGSAIAVLTSTTTLAALLGLSGGGLAAYKMKRRTSGLSEFRIRRENEFTKTLDSGMDNNVAASTAELHTTICVSGWLNDTCDFQRPWGVDPTDPPITEPLELLQRFYSVHNPEMMPKCADLLQKHKGSEEVLWMKLEAKYGRDPDNLFPLEVDPKLHVSLSKNEETFISKFVDEVVLTKSHTSTLKSFQAKNTSINQSIANVDLHLKSDSGTVTESISNSDRHNLHSQSQHTVQLSVNSPVPVTQNGDYESIVFDWHHMYGGDLYTITWETETLLNCCGLANAMMQQIKAQATKEALKQTAFAALLAAVALPGFVWNAAKNIDDPYNLMNVRSDKAGKELAWSLLQSGEKRPVTLVGYSFGARIVYSCLLELAKYQEQWEAEEDVTDNPKRTSVDDESTGKTSSKVLSDPDSDSIHFTREPFSIIEDVVIMGMPRHLNKKEWSTCRRVASGRLINCYSRKDWFLSLMFQLKNMSGALNYTCGTCPIDGVDGVENYDISDIITSHGKYCSSVLQILHIVSFGKPNTVIVM